VGETVIKQTCLVFVLGYLDLRVDVVLVETIVDLGLVKHVVEWLSSVVQLNSQQSRDLEVTKQHCQGEVVERVLAVRIQDVEDVGATFHVALPKTVCVLKL